MTEIRAALEAAKHSHVQLRVVTAEATISRCTVIDVSDDAVTLLIAGRSSRQPTEHVRLVHIHSVEDVGT